MIDEPIAAHRPTPIAGSASKPGGAPASVLLIESDADCVDALQSMLSGLPDIRDLRVARSVADATRALAEGAAQPDLILVATQIEFTLLPRAVRALKQRAPEAAIALLSVYPECVCAIIEGMGATCVSKDLNRRDLARLIRDLRDGAHDERRTA